MTEQTTQSEEQDLSCDTAGFPYAKVADLKAGDRVKVDGDFTCLPGFTEHTVLQDDTEAAGLYLFCEDGKHFLDGQIEQTPVGDVYVGIYPIASAPTSV